MTEQVIVTVNEGKVCGFKTQTAFSGAEYYSFLGVPYGQSTEGSARFKDPVKVKPWKSILDATVGKTGCTQFSLHHKKLIGSEDCLYNNIHTPKIPSKGDPLKAVIVNIHPGGFFHGSPEPWHYGAPDFIMHHDIVYVCVGYRLHILGAIHAEDFCYWCHFADTAGTNMGCIQPDDREMIHKFTGLLTTFAKTSNPNDYEGLNVNWKPTTPENPSHLIIDKKMEIRDEILNGERLEFWHKLKKKFENL